MRKTPAAGLAASLLVLSAVITTGVAAARSASLSPVSDEVASPGAAQVVEDPYYPARSNPEIDTLHDNLALAWDGKILTGTATIKFAAARNTDSVRLDLIHALEVSDATLDGKSISWSHKKFGLVLETGALTKGSRHTFTIDYSGVPHSVKAPTHRGDFGEGLGWTLDADGNVYTLQEPYGAYSWYPVNDHPSDKARYDAQVTVSAGDTAVFIGTLTGTERSARTTTYDWHVEEPVASYLTTIAIGPYTAYRDTMSDGTKATYWLLPRDESILASLKSQSADAFDWLTDHAGSYPFETFGTVVTGGQSAMETQTLVTMSREAFNRPDAVIEHEMAHQWYGDAVTPLDWQGLWLSEGWAMWMQQAYETDRGGYRYLGGLDNWRPYDEASRQASGPPGDYDPKSFGDLNVYLGPAMMLDKIRQAVGDAEFTALSAKWVAEHRYGNATRAEFLTWLDAETGQRFDKLVNLWLDSPHTPEWP